MLNACITGTCHGDRFLTVRVGYGCKQCCLHGNRSELSIRYQRPLCSRPLQHLWTKTDAGTELATSDAAEELRGPCMGDGFDMLVYACQAEGPLMPGDHQVVAPVFMVINSQHTQGKEGGLVWIIPRSSIHSQTMKTPFT